MKSITNFSLSASTLKQFQQSLEDKIAQLGKPSLGIIFANPDLDILGIHQFLDTKEIAHIGASSAGEICDGEFSVGMYSGLFMYLSDEIFKLYHTDIVDEDDLSGKELGLFAKKAFDNPGIYMMISSKNLQTNLYVKDIQEHTSSDIPLYGGHAFDNLKFDKYTVFTNHYFSHKGVVAVVFDCDKIGMFGDAYSGWDSIGTAHTVTKSEKNELLEIDGKPALDFFFNYFDYFDLEKAARNEDENFAIGDHPLKIMEGEEAAALKAPMSMNLERKSLFFNCNLPVGMKFKFCNNPQLSVSDTLINRFEKVKDEIEDIDCFLITTCKGRHVTLGPFLRKEIKKLHKIWDKPMAGWLSGGEIGNIRKCNKSYFHNATSVFTGFKLK